MTTAEFGFVFADRKHTCISEISAQSGAVTVAMLLTFSVIGTVLLTIPCSGTKEIYLTFLVITSANID